MAEMSGKSDTQLDSEHFSPYRADGKLVGRFFLVHVEEEEKGFGKRIV
jgi:hypothetical protein